MAPSQLFGSGDWTGLGRAKARDRGMGTTVIEQQKRNNRNRKGSKKKINRNLRLQATIPTHVSMGIDLRPGKKGMDGVSSSQIIVQKHDEVFRASFLGDYFVAS